MVYFFLIKYIVSNENDAELNLKNYYKKWIWLKFSKKHTRDVRNGYVYVEKISKKWIIYAI